MRLSLLISLSPRWLGVRLESLGAAATLMASLVAVEQRGGASNAGLVLSYAMQLTILMSISLRQSSVVENNVGRHQGGGLGCGSQANSEIALPVLPPTRLLNAVVSMRS